MGNNDQVHFTTPFISCGTSGARGFHFTEVTPALAQGYAFGLAMITKAKTGRSVYYVACDQRETAQLLGLSACYGIRLAGADVVWLGCVSTGVFSAMMHVGKKKGENVAGGVLITGSHMPPERIGIIPINADGTYCTTEVTDAISGRLKGMRSISLALDTENGNTIVGKQTVIHPEASYLAYKGFINSFIGQEELQGMRMLIDVGNGTGGAPANVLCRHFGITHDLLFPHPKPQPDRPSECKPESCTEAINRMKAGFYDIGLCLDGDADRVMMIDASGNVVPANVVAAIFIKNLLKKGESIVTPTNSSGVVYQLCEDMGVQVFPCKIGQPDTGRAINEHSAHFGFEATCKYAFSQMAFPWFDGLFAGFMMMKVMQMTGKTLAELAAEHPVFSRVEINVECDSVSKGQVEAIHEKMCQAFGAKAVNVDSINGLRLMQEDFTWVMVRPSGTEPLIRIYVDGPDKMKVDALGSAAKIIVEEVMGL